MAPEDPLSDPVRRLFSALQHGGAPEAAQSEGGEAGIRQGEAGRLEHGTKVRFWLRLAHGRLCEVRYRAYGCPHTLAVCEWLSARLEGQGWPLDLSGVLGGPIEWARQLQVPPAKLGRLLVIEDALRAALLADASMTKPP